jgi:phospholipid-binding lipoprotein MlaA
LLEDAALDRYEFVRDAYMQRRESLIRDGESPRTSYDEEDPTKVDGDSASRGQEPAPAKQEGNVESTVGVGNTTENGAFDEAASATVEAKEE